MFTPRAASKRDWLSVPFAYSGDDIILSDRYEEKSFFVDRVLAHFEDGDLIQIEASGPVVKKDGGRHATARVQINLLGSHGNNIPVDVTLLPEWAADLPAAVLASTEYIEYADRHSHLVLA